MSPNQSLKRPVHQLADTPQVLGRAGFDFRVHLLRPAIRGRARETHAPRCCENHGARAAAR